MLLAIHRFEAAGISALARLVLAALLGGGLALIAWDLDRTPLAALLVPAALLIQPSRVHAWLASLAYQITLTRYGATTISAWFDGYPWVGYPITALAGLLASLVWMWAWADSSETLKRVGVRQAVVYIVALIPPAALFCAGHPLLGWSYALPEGMAWFGLGLSIALTAGMAAAVQWLRQRHVQFGRWPVSAEWWLPAAVGLSAVALMSVAHLPSRPDGRVAGDLVAITTPFGKPPTSNVELVQRIERLGKISRALSGGEGAPTVMVFPETALGLYDPSFGTVLSIELTEVAKAARQTVILGADQAMRDGSMLNVAMVLRPDGTSQVIRQRQPAPFSMWHPWWDQAHFPADWLASSTAQIAPGVRARFVFCFEEYVPFFALLSEAMEEPNLSIVMSNLWSASDPLADAVQRTHSEAIARLFKRQYLRAQNLSPSLYRSQLAKQRDSGAR